MAAKAAREALHAIRKSTGHKADVLKIVVKHSSRIAGIQITGQKRRLKSELAGRGQLVLDL